MSDRPAVAALQAALADAREAAGHIKHTEHPGASGCHVCHLELALSTAGAALEAGGAGPQEQGTGESQRQPGASPAVAALRQQWDALKAVRYPAIHQSTHQFVERLLAALEAPPRLTDEEAWELLQQFRDGDTSGFATKAEVTDWVRAVVGRYVRGEAPPEPRKYDFSGGKLPPLTDELVRDWYDQVAPKETAALRAAYRVDRGSSSPPTDHELSDEDVAVFLDIHRIEIENDGSPASAVREAWKVVTANRLNRGGASSPVSTGESGAAESGVR